MFCEKCGSALKDGSIFCENCGAKVNVIENPSLISSSSALSYEPQVHNELSFKWGGGAITWFIIMLVIYGFSVLSQLTSAFMYNDNFYSSMDYILSEVTDDIFDFSELFEGMQAFIWIGLTASILILISHAVLFAKKKKAMFYTLIAGYVISSINSLVQIFVISGRFSDILENLKIYAESEYEQELNIFTSVFNAVFYSVSIIGILINIGFLIATYFVIRKNFKKLS